MSEKKCKVCGVNTDWVYNNESFCACCLCTEFDVQWHEAPRYCLKCYERIERLYYTDSNGYQFCSEECALEFNGAHVEEEKNDDVISNNYNNS